MSAARLLVLGSRNRKKVEELQRLLGPYQFDLKTLDDFPSAIEVEETGDSFGANAALKAVEQAVHLGQWVLGEDSGLAVDALDGRPGIYSARYSDPGATDERNNDRLLAELGDQPAERRTAHYVCHMTLSDPAGNVVVDCEGRCQGRIRTARHGGGGFGYDPLFEIVEYHRTFGELSPATKAMISHRARASREFLRQLLCLVDAGGWPLASGGNDR